MWTKIKTTFSTSIQCIEQSIWSPRNRQTKRKKVHLKNVMSCKCYDTQQQESYRKQKNSEAVIGSELKHWKLPHREMASGEKKISIFISQWCMCLSVKSLVT